MEQRLTALWYRESAGFSMLAPLGWLYGLVMALRRLAYARGLLKTQRAAKPVIVVGNLTVGGTGKTPLVAWLAQQLAQTGLRVGIVSRGYGRAGSNPVAVHGTSSWRQVGDEPMLLASLTGCDVVVARDRFAGAQQLVALGVDVIIADDGLQHLRLARDCEIVVIDGARGFGNGRLLPAGPLREPASRVRDASLVVVNGTPEHASLRAGVEGSLQMSLVGGEALRVDGLAMPEPLEHFRGRRVHAVAGIGHPQRFFRDLRARGLDIVEHAFPDHHPFTVADLTFGDDLPVLMTQKDAVRCREIEDARLWYVPVVARFSEPQARELLDRVALALAPGE